MSLITQSNDLSFDVLLSEAQRPVLVAFLGSWDQHHSALVSTLEDIALEFADEVDSVWLEVEECPELAVRFQISVIPTYLLVSPDGTLELAKGIGLACRTHLAIELEQALGGFK